MIMTLGRIPGSLLSPASIFVAKNSVANYPRIGERMLNTKATMMASVVAVLFQDIEPPAINGVRKPRKPSGNG